MEKKMIYIIAFIIIAILYIFFSSIYMRKRGKEAYNYFNTSYINGKIEYIDIKYHGSNFKIVGVDKDFVFYPHETENTKGIAFQNFSKSGDVVLKQAYSDTLILIKNRVHYYYTFEKIE